MKKRFSFINDINYISNLPQIKTISELKKHIGEIVLMRYFNTTFTNIVCFWMGVLSSKYLDGYRDDEGIQYKHITTKDFLFITLGSKGLDITNKLQSKNEFQFTKEMSSSAQDYIFILDKRFILYYNLCKAALTNQTIKA